MMKAAGINIIYSIPGLKDGKPERYNYAGYAAQAGTNVMGNLSIRF